MRIAILGAKTNKEKEVGESRVIMNPSISSADLQSFSLPPDWPGFFFFSLPIS